MPPDAFSLHLAVQSSDYPSYANKLVTWKSVRSHEQPQCGGHKIWIFHYMVV